jgi:hypothetical protein
MKNNIFFTIILLCLLLASCVSETGKAIDKAVNGDVIVSGNDTFDIVVDTHTVISSERLPARNVMEEGSPVWLNTTNLDSTFKTRTYIPIGSTQVYKTAKKRK